MLGLFALVGGHLFYPLVPYPGGRGGMDVVPSVEGGYHVLVSREVGHDAELYLAVVGGEEEAALLGYEAAAYLLAVIVPHGYVLQVGVAAGEPSRGGDGLVEGGVYVPRLGVHQLGQGLYVGAQQLAQSPVVQYVGHDGGFAPQLLQHFLAGDELSFLGLAGLLHQLHLVEQHVAHLLGRGDVEGVPRLPVDALLQLLQSFAQSLGSLLQRLGVQPHARQLHVRQHVDQWHLDVPEQPLGVHFLQLRLQDVLQPQRDVRVLGGVLIDFPGRQVPHVGLLLSLGAYQLFYVDGLVVEIHLRHVVHVVPQLGLQEVVGYHRVEQAASHLHAIVPQHLYVVLDVLSHLQYPLVFVNGFEDGDHFLGLLPLTGHGDVKCLVFLHREAQTHQFGLYRVGGSGLRV